MFNVHFPFESNLRLPLTLSDDDRPGRVVRDDWRASHDQRHLGSLTVREGDDHLALVDGSVRLLNVVNLQGQCRRPLVLVDLEPAVARFILGTFLWHLKHLKIHAFNIPSGWRVFCLDCM